MARIYRHPTGLYNKRSLLRYLQVTHRKRSLAEYSPKPHVHRIRGLHRAAVFRITQKRRIGEGPDRVGGVTERLVQIHVRPDEAWPCDHLSGRAWLRGWRHALVPILRVDKAGRTDAAHVGETQRLLLHLVLPGKERR